MNGQAVPVVMTVTVNFLEVKGTRNQQEDGRREDRRSVGLSKGSSLLTSCEGFSVTLARRGSTRRSPPAFSISPRDVHSSLEWKLCSPVKRFGVADP